MSDEDFEPFVGGPPPDPSERTWRHPSEIAAQAQADALAELTTTRGGRRAISSWFPANSSNLLVAGSLGAAACLTVVALFQFAMANDSSSVAGGPQGTIEAGILGESEVFGVDTASLDNAGAASGLAPITSTPPTTIAVSSTAAPAAVSPLAVSVADNQLVGIAVGTNLVATGVLVDGYLITSASAVGSDLSVSYVQQERRALAYLVGIDPYSDLAVFRPSTESRVGRTLESLSTSVGEGSDLATDDALNPSGETSASNTAGLGDEVTSVTLTDDGVETSVGTILGVEHSGITTDGQPLIGLIDTSIRRPGQLGSVLINTDGEVVGIVVDTSSSLASAVPIRDATAIADRLNHQGWANETWIGFLGIDQDDGVEVVDVTPDAPADLAGLQPGDVIRYLDGARIDHMGGITAGLRRAAPGDTIVVVVERSGELVGMRIQVLAYAAAQGDDQLVTPAGSSIDGSTTDIATQGDPVSEPIDG